MNRIAFNSKMEEENPKRQKLNPSVNFFISKETQLEAQKSMKSNTDFFFNSGSQHIKIKGNPYPFCGIKNLFCDEFLKKVKEELLNEKFVQKSNDLYEFNQSRDLNFTEMTHLKELREIIYSEEFVEMMQNLTGTRLRRKFDMSGHRYGDKSVLLCHDDELEGRKIAYILYLVPPGWTKEDGGTLDLYSVDENNQPKDIISSFTPEWNNFGFFEVTPTSFHQVSEILNQNKERVSISGWFHSPDKIPRPPPFKESLKIENCLETELDLEQFINPSYFKSNSIEAIKKNFIEQSSIELKDFLKEDIYSQLLQEFKEQTNPSTTNCNYIGPANRRHYQLLTPPKDSTLHTLQTLFQSKKFSNFLYSLTNVSTNSCYGEIRNFNHGSYTLVHDHALEPHGIDVTFFCLDEKETEWDENWGGQLVYMDRDDELLTVFPSKNSLLCVFRDPGVMRFVKYINHYSTQIRPEFSFVYLEDSEEENKNEE